MKAFIPFAILAFAATSALAHDLDGNADVRQSILNDHVTDFVGTSLSAAKAERGFGDTYGWAVLDAQAGSIKSYSDPEKGYGDAYGSILNDL